MANEPSRTKARLAHLTGIESREMDAIIAGNATRLFPSASSSLRRRDDREIVPRTSLVTACSGGPFHVATGSLFILTLPRNHGESLSASI